MPNGNGSVLRVAFNDAVTLRAIEAAHARLLDALRSHGTVEVDCSNVGEIDIAFVQLLVSARRTAVEWGKTFTLTAPAQGALRDALERGGFLVTPNTPGEIDGDFWNKRSATA